MQVTEELVAQADPSLALGRYRLGPRIGAGGFGTVYEARDERLGRAVAVKAIPSDGRADERARREAHAVARLDHPGIVSVFDAGEEDGSRFLVSELVRGATLAQLEAAGAVSDRDVLRIGLALADALAHAHERGVIHRDVKPQNVMVPERPRSPYGAAKLTDFGVAHLAGDEPLTRTGDVVGTLAYMAPEQAAGERVDERCDLYALGLVLYEALAGRQPGARGLARPPRCARVGTVQPAAAHQARRPAAGAVRGARPHAAPAPRRARRPDRPRRRAGRGAARRLRRGRHRRPAPARGRVRAAVVERPRRAPRSAPACWSRSRSPACCPTPRCPPSAPASARRSSSALVPGAGWMLAAAATLVAMTFGSDAARRRRADRLPRRRAAAAADARRRDRLVGARARAAARPRRARRRLPRARRHRAQRLDARRRSAPAAPGGCCSPSRCSATTCCSGVARPAGAPAASTAPPASRRARSCSPLVTSGRRSSWRSLWAAAAVVMPWLVRGRSLPADIVGATAWSAGLAAATASLGVAVTGAHAARPGCGSARSGHHRRGLEMGPRHDRGT